MSVKTKTVLVLNAMWLFAFAAVASFSSAQTTGLERQGQQSIVMPLEIVAGQPATLAVLGSNGRIAPGVKVVLSNGDVLTTDESGRAHFLQPTGAGVMFARIEGSPVREAADVLLPDAGGVGLRVTEAPRFVPLENHFSIGGAGFQGDADQNRVKVGDKRILILASSPLQLIAMPSEKSRPGPNSLVVMEGTTEVAANVTLIDITTADSDGVSIRRGKKSSILIRAVGTTEPVDLVIQNLSLGVVQFPHGNEQRVRTAGGTDNSADVEVKGLSIGSFSYSANLEDTSIGANAPVARDFLEAAAKIAPPEAAIDLTALLGELHGERVDAAKMRDDLDGMLSRGGSEDFQALIRAARRALAGE